MQKRKEKTARRKAFTSSQVLDSAKALNPTSPLSLNSEETLRGHQQ